MRGNCFKSLLDSYIESFLVMFQQKKNPRKPHDKLEEAVPFGVFGSTLGSCRGRSRGPVASEHHY